MMNLSVGEFKTRFSEVVKALSQGREVGVVYGRKKVKLGVFVPASRYQKKKIKFGIMGPKASFKILPGFKMTDEEFLAS